MSPRYEVTPRSSNPHIGTSLSKRKRLVSSRLEKNRRNNPPVPIPPGGLSGVVVGNPSHRHERQRATSHHSFPSCRASRARNRPPRNPCHPYPPFPPSCGTKSIGSLKNQCSFRSSRIARMYYRRCWRRVTPHTMVIVLLQITIIPCHRQGWEFLGMA